jgi:hypothetical protein
MFRGRRTPECKPEAHSSQLIFSVGDFPLFLQGCEEIGTAVGAEEFVIFDRGGGADAGRRERLLDANDAGGEADADSVGQSDVRRKGEGDFEFGSGLNGTVEIEENATGTDVLGFSLHFVGTFKTDNGGQAHVKAPHRPPFL